MRVLLNATVFTLAILLPTTFSLAWFTFRPESPAKSVFVGGVRYLASWGCEVDGRGGPCPPCWRRARHAGRLHTAEGGCATCPTGVSGATESPPKAAVPHASVCPRWR